VGHPRGIGALGGRRGIAILLLVSLLVLMATGAATALVQYSQVRAEAADGVSHLKRVQAVLQPLLQHSGVPDAATLATVERELGAAEHDFALSRGNLGGGVFGAVGHSPVGGGAVSAGAALVAAADEACLAGLDLVREARTFAPLLQSDLFAAASTSASGSSAAGTSSSSAASPQPAAASTTPAPGPLLTAAMLQRLTADYEDAVRHLTAAIGYARGADLAALPANLITAQQRAQLASLLAQWPQIAPELATIDSWLRVAPALLGLSGPTRLLVELMDRGEVRATGGYIGDYGVLTIENGRMQPFSLTDVLTLDYPYAWAHNWQNAPAPYSWFPFHGFGLRDSNISPDFPTAARLGIHQLAIEAGTTVQGVVALDAPVIAQVLKVVGPITVPSYHQVVTADNLEALTRLYTENPQVRKSAHHELFTIELGHEFMSKLHGLSSTQMVAIAQAMLASLRTKDLQVYLSDPAAEALLARQGLDGSLTRGPDDGLTIVDDNLSSNKSNLFATLSSEDTVTLDAQGTATHHLTVTYHFDTATNSAMLPYLYGRRIYRAYLRIYVPPSAQLVSLDGFSPRFKQIGTSDEPGRAMWGGYVYVHDGIPAVLHVVWSVPHVATRAGDGQWHYALTVQHQAETDHQLALTIALPAQQQPKVSYTGAPDQDRTFSI
jgi:hypothetical protein